MERAGCIFLAFVTLATLLFIAVPLTQAAAVAASYQCYSCNSTTDANCGMLGFTGEGIPKVTCGSEGCVTDVKFNASTNTYETVWRGCATADHYMSGGCYFYPSEIGRYRCYEKCGEDDCNGAQPVQNETCYSCDNCGNSVDNSTETIECPYSCLAAILSDPYTGRIISSERACGAFPNYGTTNCRSNMALNTCVQQCTYGDLCNKNLPIPPTTITSWYQVTTTPTTKRDSTTISSSISCFRFYSGASSRSYFYFLMTVSMLYFKFLFSNKH